jgi:hypothetical protein
VKDNHSPNGFIEVETWIPLGNGLIGMELAGMITSESILLSLFQQSDE